jgi:hypothetical protein
MEPLPSPFVRSALLSVAALVVCTRAAAQIPVAPEPSPAAPQASPPSAPGSAMPSGSTPAPATAQPAPAKADQLKEPAVTRAEAAVDDEAQLEDESSATESPRRTWYGWQTLTADGISTFLVITAASLAESDTDAAETLVWASLASYEFAPGILHFVHQNPGRGFASFGIRLGMPLAGAFVGAAAASGCRGYECEAVGAGVGFLFGMGGAIAIDAAVLAYEDPESSRRVARVLPFASVAPGRAYVGLAGEL